MLARAGSRVRKALRCVTVCGDGGVGRYSSRLNRHKVYLYLISGRGRGLVGGALGCFFAEVKVGWLL